MKKNITIRLGFILLLAILFSLVTNYFVQFHSALTTRLEDTNQMFWEMRQILAANEAEITLIERDFTQSCLVRAKAAAYIVQHSPEVIPDSSELEKIAQFLSVDELHIFDTEGTIYAGSCPQYFGMNFNSGEQMQFFLPMLNDTTLELCQDITPNTAEAKLMQYAAVWCEDASNIVQIGMKPERVMEAKKKTDLSYIFSLVTSEPDTDIYAIDPHSFSILASTQNNCTGCNALDFGFEKEDLFTKNKIFFQEINGTNSICIFDSTNSLILASVRRSSILYQDMLRYTVFLALYVIILSSLALFFIVRYLNRNIIRGINSMNDRLVMIGNGNLSLKLPPQPTPEMTELSSHINDMVTSLINQQTQLSLILDNVKLPLGTYDYNTRTKQLLINPRAVEILALPVHPLNGSVNPRDFCQKMNAILASPFNKERNIYIVPGDTVQYVHVEYFQNESNILGLIMDVTTEFQEKQIIAHERDVDLLTNLLSRRAFYREMETLFAKPEVLGNAVFIMIDSDNLKFVNDTYGHSNGDLYLQAIAGILENFPATKLAARLSGDEFILLLYGYESRQQLEELISLLYVHRESTYVTFLDDKISVKFSAGCAFYPEDGSDYSSLMRLADQKMYIDKRTRKGTV